MRGGRNTLRLNSRVYCPDMWILISAPCYKVPNGTCSFTASFNSSLAASSMYPLAGIARLIRSILRILTSMNTLWLLGIWHLLWLLKSVAWSEDNHLVSVCFTRDVHSCGHPDVKANDCWSYVVVIEHRSCTTHTNNSELQGSWRFFIRFLLSKEFFSKDCWWCFKDI